MLNKDKKEERRNTQHTIKKKRRELTQEFIEKNSSYTEYKKYVVFWNTNQEAWTHREETKKYDTIKPHPKKSSRREPEPNGQKKNIYIYICVCVCVCV